MNLVPYIKTLWRNRELDPQGQVITPGTPVNADNLNKMEEGIEDVTEEVIGHNEGHIQVVITEESIPIEEREAGSFYFVVTDKAVVTTSGIKVSPNMGLKVE